MKKGLYVLQFRLLLMYSSLQVVTCYNVSVEQIISIGGESYNFISSYRL